MYVYNDEMLSMPQQVAKNKEDIKTLQNTIPYPINWRGLWNQDNTYNKYDGVNFQGSSYVCISDVAIQSTTPPPQAPFVWQVFAQQGEQGPTGATGPQGEQGPIGLSNLFVDEVLHRSGEPKITSTYTLHQGDFNRTPIESESCLVYIEDITTHKIYITMGIVTKINQESTNNWTYVITTSVAQISGTDGKGFNFMGAWESGSDHYINDVVTYNGNAYVCISDITNSTTNPASDTTHWAIFTTAQTYYRHNLYISYSNENYDHKFNCTIINTSPNPINSMQDLILTVGTGKKFTANGFYLLKNSTGQPKELRLVTGLACTSQSNNGLIYYQTAYSIDENTKAMSFLNIYRTDISNQLFYIDSTFEDNVTEIK